MKKDIKAIGFTFLGLLMLIIGLVVIKYIQEPQGIMQVLPYIFVGIGCGIFGHNFGGIISNKALLKYPEEAKKIEIEQKDERNLMIANKAKAKAYDLMIFVYGGIMVAFALMQIGMVPIITLAISYLFVVFSAIFFRFKYEKEM